MYSEGIVEIINVCLQCAGSASTSAVPSLRTTSIKDVVQAIAAAVSHGSDPPTLALLDPTQVRHVMCDSIH